MTRTRTADHAPTSTSTSTSASTGAGGGTKAIGRWPRLAAGGLAYGILLLPVSLLALVITVAGRGALAMRWWRAIQWRVLRRHPEPPTRHRRAFAATGHAAASVLLGLVALVPLLLVTLFVLRGVLYGLVTDPPHTLDWGGPSTAGAWLAHFLIGIPLAVLALVLLRGLAALHVRLTDAVDSTPPSRWVVPITVALALAAATFAVAWPHQI
jgi:cytochrome b561